MGAASMQAWPGVLSREEALRAHVLTDADRAALATDGFLVIPEALSPAYVDRLLAAIERCVHPSGTEFVNEADVIGRDPTFLDLVDIPTVLPKIVGLLGWNIWMNHSHVSIIPPIADSPDFFYSWHRDGGDIHADLPPPVPRLQVKVGFYLTDTTAPRRGQTMFVQGSPSDPSNVGTFRGLDSVDLGRVKPICVPAGAAVLYDHRLVHSSRSPNAGPLRTAVFVQWAYRWMAGVDPVTSDGVAELVRDDPVRAQLLGLGFGVHEANSGRSNRFYPLDDDVPLRRCLAEVYEEEAGAPSARALSAPELRRRAIHREALAREQEEAARTRGRTKDISGGSS
jgi:ectoine hydroxylase